MAGLRKGVYDQLITAAVRSEIDALPETLKARISTLAPDESVEYLARHLAERVRVHLRAFEEEADQSPVQFANQLLAFAGDQHQAEAAILEEIHDAVVTHQPSLVIPLSQSALVTNDPNLNYHTVLKSELSTADRVDWVCPFIGSQGLNLILDVLQHFGKKLRVVTTTYLGATHQRALNRLAQTGAEIKIVYERPEQKTGLHAKAWIFHRDSGFTTATVGSSNLSPRALVDGASGLPCCLDDSLSPRALVDGLEWNIRLSFQDAASVLRALMVTFERIWADPQFENYDPVRDAEKLSRALKSQRAERAPSTFFADLQPLPHQKEALADLEYSRLEGKSTNLVVAATGTGKTLLAAFDYDRYCRQQGGRPNLLFVAHRGDILDQSCGAFRAVLRDGSFGELNVGGARAEHWRHVFASVQSLSERTLSEISPNHFDYIVIDEFHHAAAPTYQRLLDHFEPKQLLALTATPERSDGRNVIERFGAPTYELRLWHALDRKLLCPFHYFGIDDETDLSTLSWTAGRYADAELETALVDHGERRARIIIRELLEKAEEPDRMRTIAFCATIRHAEFMAEQLRAAGLQALALHSGLSAESRRELVSRFRQGDLPVICTVDLFNEGVDIPEVNTVLFLRPTESSTVFIQQLGRGLRNHPEKGALTVLDFVGQQNRKFRMDLRFRAMTGLSRSELTRAIKSDFPSLPAGCHIKLDRKTQDRVLKSVREAIPSSTKAIVEELRRMASAGIPITLSSFIEETGLELSDVYNNRSFTSLKHAASLEHLDVPETKRVSSFLHVDDRRRVEAYRTSLAGEMKHSSFDRMLLFPLSRSVFDRSIHPLVRDEMLELLSVLEGRVLNRPAVAADLPFGLHGNYSRDELVAPFRDNPESMRQGTFYVPSLELDIHILTLRKSDRDFSPTLRYADYFISEELLHWESQSTTSLQSPTGQRLIHGCGRHLFFVREEKFVDGRAAPFMCIGFAKPVSYESEKPIQLVWRLDHPVPDHVYVRFKAAAG